MDDKSTGKVEIIRIPRGKADYWVRAAWVNLQLPCLSEMAFPEVQVAKRMSVFLDRVYAVIDYA